MFFLFLIRNIAFVFFFSAIGMWFLSFIPIFVWLLFFLSVNQSIATESTIDGEYIKSFFLRYAFSFARCCVMLGMRWILDVFGISHVYSALFFVLINIVLWIWSYVINYQDGKEMFHIGYYVAAFLVLWSSFSLLDLQTRWKLIMIWLSLTMALYAFIVFIGGALWWWVHRKLSYSLFFLFILSLMFIIYHYTQDDIIYTLVLSQVLLMALYSIIFGVYRYAEDTWSLSFDDKHTTLKRILSWKKLTKIKQTTMSWYDDFVHDGYLFLTQIDMKTKWFISFLNILLIIGQIWIFLVMVGNSEILTHELLLRFGIVAFFVNYLLLKQIWFPHRLQRITSFILINFGIYLSIINVFGIDPMYLVGIWTVWSLLNSVVMFQTKRLARRHILQENDYLYRIGSNMLATLCNIYFVFLLSLSLQSRFFLVLVYFGLQMFLTLYNLRYTGKKVSEKLHNYHI